MAYITQYEVDKKQDADTSRMAAGIADIGAILGQNRRRALDEKRAQFKQGMEFASMGITPDANEQKELQEAGYSQSLLEKYAPVADEARKTKLGVDAAKNKKAVYEADQLNKPIQERDEYIKSIDSAKARNDLVIGRMGEQEKARVGAEQRAIENDKIKSINKVVIPDFDIANADVIPSAKDAEEVKKQNAANKTFTSIGDRAIQRIESIDHGKMLTNPREFANEYANLKQDITEMRLQAKELANLGVLNGPDLKLVDETLGSVGNVDFALSGKKGVSDRVRNAIGTAKMKLENAASARGYKAKSNLAPEDDAAINWAKANANDPRAQQILQLHGAK